MDKSILDSVLQLKPADRMRLINMVYASLEHPDLQIDEVWYNEAERRLAAHQSGKSQGIPAEDVIGQRP